MVNVDRLPPPDWLFGTKFADVHDEGEVTCDIAYVSSTCLLLVDRVTCSEVVLIFTLLALLGRLTFMAVNDGRTTGLALLDRPVRPLLPEPPKVSDLSFKPA